MASSAHYRSILYAYLHQGHPHIFWNLMGYSLHLFGIFLFFRRYQIHTTSRCSLFPDWRLHLWSVLFYHNIEADLSLNHKIFQEDHWLPFWIYQPHGQHWMYYPNIICPQHFTYDLPWLFSSRVSAFSALDAVTAISYIMTYVSFFVSPFWENSSLISIENIKTLVWKSPTTGIELLWNMWI